MKISLHSDVHIEFYPVGITLNIPQDADVIVLAGDIGVGEDVIQFITRLSEEHPDKQIIFVSGNHEFYGEDVVDLREKYSVCFKHLSNVHYLEDESVTIGDVVFHGCTLWSGFNVLGAERSAYGMAEARRSIADFYRISYDGYTIRPEDMRMLHNHSLCFLKSALLEHAGQKQVIVTHFPPLKECKHGEIVPGILDCYFNNDLKDLFYLVQLEAWLYGHNHWSDDFMYSGCRVVSNQRSYPREGSQKRYIENLLIEI